MSIIQFTMYEKHMHGIEKTDRPDLSSVSKWSQILLDTDPQDLENQGYKYLISGDKYLFSGQKYLFPGQKYLFSGDKYLFSGQKYLFLGDKYLFSGQNFGRFKSVPNKNCESSG